MSEIEKILTVGELRKAVVGLPKDTAVCFASEGGWSSAARVLIVRQEIADPFQFYHSGDPFITRKEGRTRRALAVMDE